MKTEMSACKMLIIEEMIVWRIIVIDKDLDDIVEYECDWWRWLLFVEEDDNDGKSNDPLLRLFDEFMLITSWCLSCSVKSVI